MRLPLARARRLSYLDAEEGLLLFRYITFSFHMMFVLLWCDLLLASIIGFNNFLLKTTSFLLHFGHFPGLVSSVGAVGFVCKQMPVSTHQRHPSMGWLS